MPTLKGGTLQQLAGDYKTTTEELQKLNPNLRTDTTYAVGEVKFPEAQVDTTQPSPAQFQGDLSKVGTSAVGPDGKPIYDVFAGQEHIADPNDPRLKGVDIAGLPEGQAPGGFQSKFSQGFQNANKALGEKALDVSSAQGTSLVQQFAPQKQNDLASVFLQSNPILGEITKSLQEFMNPTTQRESLVSAYKSMSKELGLEPLNEKIINLEKLMRGTDDAIREQITASGGFANENSIRGLVNVRNKAFLEEYTTLQQTLAGKQKYLDNLISLEQQDRQAISERFDRGLNLAFKLADYQQRGQQFAQSSYQWLIQNTGFDGLYDATNGDPYAVDLIEKTLGLPQGGLANSAQQARLAKAQAEQERQLGLQEQQLGLEGQRLDLIRTQEQIKTEQARRAEIYSSISGTTTKPPTQDQLKVAGFRDRLVESNQIINQLGSQFTSPYSGLAGFLPNFLKSEDRQEYEQAQRNFINAVLRRESGAVISDEEFDNARQQYFPQPGDQEGVLQQKAANRLTVLNSFSRESGSTPLNTDNNDPLGLF